MQDRTPNRDIERPAAASRLTEASRDESANHQLGEANRETSRLGQRHTVKEAAKILGITVDAVRGRLRRGTLDSVRVDGVVYVLLDAASHQQQSDKSATESTDAPQQAGDQSELVGELRGQIDWLRREVERKDTIIMQMAQRIPELPSGALQEPPEADSEAPDPEDAGVWVQCNPGGATGAVREALQLVATLLRIRGLRKVETLLYLFWRSKSNWTEVVLLAV